MTASPVDEQVRAVAAPVAERSGLVVESVVVSRAGRRSVVRVVVDLPDDAAGSVALDAVADVSRAISDAFDAAGVLADRPYVLEVSSPGVDRPLTERRHWLRARGRLVRAVLRDGTQPQGRLERVDETGIVLAGVPAPVGWEQLVRGHVQVEFSRPDGADGPDGAAGGPDVAGRG